MKFLRGATRRALAGAGLTLFALTGVAIAARLPATPAYALVNCSTNSAAMNEAEQRVLMLMNAERAKEGVAPLKVSEALNRAAAWKSADASALPPHFSHTDSLGRTPVQQPPGNRAVDCGYATWAGENIAFGFDSDGVVAAWMASPGHRANILNPSYKVAGVGLVGPAWTVNFGVVDDSGSQPVPSTPTQPAPPTPPLATASPTRTPTVAPTTVPTATPTQPPVQYQHAVSVGFNLVTYVGGTRSAASAFASIDSSLVAAYRWDANTETWLKYIPGAPAWVSTLSSLRNGDVVFVESTSGATWSY